MRNIITILLFTLCTSSLFATNGITDPTVYSETVFNSTAISYVIQPTDFLLAVSHNTDTNKFSVSTNAEISFVRFYNDKDELEFQMPISSKRMHLELNDYPQGVYNIQLDLSGEKVTSQLIIK